MSSIVNDEDEAVSVTNQKDILTELTKFYTNLYSQKTEGGTRIAVDRFSDGIEFPKLEVEEEAVCEGMVTAEEARRALDSMKNGSAPGGDVLTIKFFNFLGQS